MTLDPIAEPLSGPVLARAIDQLAAVDTDIRETVARIGYPIPRLRPPGFTTLLRIMVSQQISTRAAAAIWGRLTAACEEAATPERFLALDEAALRSIGLSGRKIDYGRGLARALLDGSLDLNALATIPEDEAVSEICRLKGFGRWSAEIYLLFAQSRGDSFPADDLALQVGMQRLRRLDERPDRKTMERHAEGWRPLRGCGAILLWHVYGAATLDG